MGKIHEALAKAEENRGKKGEEPVLSSSTEIDFPEELVVLHKPGSAIAEQFRFMRSRVIWPREGKIPRTILVTSTVPSEGKSFVASNLAATISQGMDEYVLLVDTDLRNSRINSIFGLDGDLSGLSEHLAFDTPLEDLLQKTSINKLTVLPAGKETANPAELLSSIRMKQFIREVRERYPDRHIIFDSPPAELAPESMVIANETDGTFLIVMRSRTPRDLVAVTMERFSQEKLLGIIFNGYQRPVKHYGKNKSKYGYGYGYGHGYGYGKSYKGKAE